MMIFWLVAILTAALAALVVMWRAKPREAQVEGAPDARALAEVDALHDRGLLDDEAWRVMRAEAGRRVLATAGEAAPAPDPRRGVLVLGGLGVMAAVALAIYLAAGSPGAADQPHAARVQQWADNLETLDAPRLAAVAALRASESPDDPMAQAVLGMARMEAGDPIAAASAFRRALALQPDNASFWARLGEALTMAARGETGPDAEAAFRQALVHDPDDRSARFFLGRALLARGEADEARALWGPLIASLPADDPRRARLQAELAAAN